MSDEDKLVNALIKSHRESNKEMQEGDPNPDDIGVYPEAHYNHYGNRGVADLYLTIGDWDGHLIEAKSESAVRQATGANQIIRQFNKMREFFFPGSNHSTPTNSLTFELCFMPSRYNFQHIAENAEMYDSAVKQAVEDVASKWVQVNLTVRPADPESSYAVVMFSDSGSIFRDGIGEHDFAEYVKNQNPMIFNEYEEVIRDITHS